ncbi:histidine triad nucleotide-binding protein [Caminibacter pacificus]|uniref:Histidine triad (HIT) family protein n=1 Tax=Caminibacter pacificus TaxID=1424653 RepID=A0AAJ4RE05_9BACT|nr:histidine triad nucleotide-binding protein [Caminibacter pacificus]QCI28415.1 histidine triad nucleotide-binding protein [Caminibacter pacificus]ROR40861.1 histidine triad (HIT) family protein [Caminibacter pacificus]
MECIFCKIVNGEIPSNKVLENDKFLAFHDINPIAPIHVLIIPKDHYEKFDSTPVELLPEMAEFIKEVAKELNITDYRLITNNGKGAGQEVFHLHIHMVANPNGKLLWPKLA